MRLFRNIMASLGVVVFLLGVFLTIAGGSGEKFAGASLLFAGSILIAGVLISAAIAGTPSRTPSDSGASAEVTVRFVAVQSLRCFKKRSPRSQICAALEALPCCARVSRPDEGG